MSVFGGERVVGKVTLFVAMLALAISLPGCGGPTRNEIVVTAFSCRYDGPSSMEEGDATFTLLISGLGNAGLTVVRLDEGKTFDDLVEHYEATDDPVNNRAEWEQHILTLRVGDRYEPDGDSQDVRLDRGEYAVICIDYPYDEDPPEAEPIASLSVTNP